MHSESIDNAPIAICICSILWMFNAKEVNDKIVNRTLNRAWFKVVIVLMLLFILYTNAGSHFYFYLMKACLEN